jgi:hypothetical protein
MGARKVGGIWFVRVGQLQVSVCFTRKHAALWDADRAAAAVASVLALLCAACL